MIHHDSKRINFLKESFVFTVRGAIFEVIYSFGKDKTVVKSANFSFLRSINDLIHQIKLYFLAIFKVLR